MPFVDAFNKAMVLLRTRTPQADDDKVSIQKPRPVDLGDYYFRDPQACPDISHTPETRIPEPATGRVYVFETVAEDMANALFDRDQTVYGWNKTWNKSMFASRKELYDAVIQAQKDTCGNEGDAGYFRKMAIQTADIPCENINTFLNGSTVSTLCTMAEYSLMQVQGPSSSEGSDVTSVLLFVFIALLVLALFLVFEFATSSFGLVGTNESRKMQNITADMARPM